MKNKQYFPALFIAITMLAACKQGIMVENKDDNGVLIERYEVNKDNIKHGSYTSYFSDGAVNETSNYVDGKLDGLRTIFYPNGKEEIVERYEMDVMNGPYLVYHDNGNLKQVVNFYDGVMSGPLKVFYADGTLKEEVTMVDNNENGPFKEFYPNGNVHWEGSYLDGDNEFGLLKEYNEQGELIKKMNCDSMAICKTIWTKENGDIINE